MLGRLIGVAVRVVAAALLLLPSAAGTARAGDRHAALVVGVGTRKVLHAVEANARWYPASLTKMMTLYVTFAEIEAGRLSLDEILTVSSTAAAQPPTEIGLATGDEISVEDAIAAVVVRSANDAAVVLAERIAGSEAAFAARMTETARRLGMQGTVYRNASGLPDPAQLTTAHDQAVLGRALIEDFPEHYRFFSLTHFTYRKRTLSGYNGLLVSYAGADGLKTGFTCDSGYNVVTSAVRDGRRLLAVYLGGKTNASRNAAVAKLLNDGFAGKLDGDGPALATLATPSDAPPPRQLGPEQCTPGAAASSSGRLPGWGVVFGAFPQKSTAQAMIKEMRGLLKPVLSGGQPLPMKRTREGTTLYTALLVGLQQDQATSACKRLWDSGHYCLALRPEVLNNPDALWR